MPLLTQYLKYSRYKRIAPYISGRVLDLGCGPAYIYQRYGARMTSYHGVDRPPERIMNLQEQYPEATFSQRDLDQSHVQSDQKFDSILMVALIEHLFNQEFVVRGLKELLSAEGRIIITTPTPFGNDVIHRIGAAIGLFSGNANHDHIVLYNRRRFELLAREVGLVVEYHQYFQLGCNQLAILRLE